MSKVLFIEYPKCSTCQKAKKWLEENEISFEDRDIVNNTPTAEELKMFLEKGNLPLKKLLNTSGIKYRELGLSKKIPTMEETEVLNLLASDGMLLKRPILVTNKAVCTGFKEEEWKKALGI